MRGEGLVIPGDSGREVCVRGTKGEDQRAEWSPGYLSHLLGPHSVLNQPLHICSHGEARSLENLFGKMQQLLSGVENQAT